MAGRIYEYVADDGTIYWSLTKKPSIVSPPTRLLLQHRRGDLLEQHIVKLRGWARLQEKSDPESDVNG